MVKHGCSMKQVQCHSALAVFYCWIAFDPMKNMVTSHCYASCQSGGVSPNPSDEPDKFGSYTQRFKTIFGRDRGHSLCDTPSPGLGLAGLLKSRVT